MEEQYLKMHERILDYITRELRAYLDSLMRDNFNPDELMRFFAGMRIDSVWISGLVGKLGGIDPYLVLGLERAAPDEAVRKRYLELMARIHPDRAGEAFEALTKLVNDAYQSICRERGTK